MGGTGFLLCPPHGHCPAPYNFVSAVRHHWRGLVKIGVAAATVVGTSACVLASAGICGALAFGVAGVQLSGGAIAVGFAAGAAEGAADYALDPGRHSLRGYLRSAGTEGGLDSVFAGLPEEVLMGEWAQGAHSAQLGFREALRWLPHYLLGGF
jgi:hypothetical protein